MLVTTKNKTWIILPFLLLLIGCGSTTSSKALTPKEQLVAFLKSSGTGVEDYIYEYSDLDSNAVGTYPHISYTSWCSYDTHRDWFHVEGRYRRTQRDGSIQESWGSLAFYYGFYTSPQDFTGSYYDEPSSGSGASGQLTYTSVGFASNKTVSSYTYSCTYATSYLKDSEAQALAAKAGIEMYNYAITDILSVLSNHGIPYFY
jgi:hypothetical protein